MHFGTLPAAMLVAVATLLFAAPASAFRFVPSASEWATWPEYCRARYAQLSKGQREAFSKGYPPANIEKWSDLLGQESFVHIHHYCAAIALVQRAAMSASARERVSVLEYANNNAKYAAARIPAKSPVYAEVQGTLMRVESQLATARIAAGLGASSDRNR